MVKKKISLRGKAIFMKALVLEEYGKFEYKEVPAPVIKHGYVMIKVMACAVCGSDVHGMDGSTGRRQPPIIMGHEAAGVICEIGEGVTGFQINDRVTFDSTIFCDECVYCKNGKTNLCDNRRVLGVSCDEFRIDGAFAEYVLVPAHVLYKLPDSVTFVQASMIEPLSVAYHAVELSRLGHDRIKTATAVVIGCGTIGLFIAQLLRVKGYASVVVSDIVEERLKLAEDLGFSSRCEMVGELTSRLGADISFDAVGTDGSVANALKVLRKGGECVLVGNISPNVSLPLQHVVTNELTLLGSCVSAGEYSECLDLIASGKVETDKLISKVVPLSEGNEWIRRVYNKERGLYKIVLVME